MKLRSRYPNYRWRDVQFANHRAEIADKATAEAARRDPMFGIDFHEVTPDMEEAEHAEAERIKTKSEDHGSESRATTEAESKPSKGGKK